jgi:hypothetical protein
VLSTEDLNDMPLSSEHPAHCSASLPTTTKEFPSGVATPLSPDQRSAGINIDERVGNTPRPLRIARDAGLLLTYLAPIVLGVAGSSPTKLGSASRVDRR